MVIFLQPLVRSLALWMFFFSSSSSSSSISSYSFSSSVLNIVLCRFSGVSVSFSLHIVANIISHTLNSMHSTLFSYLCMYIFPFRNSYHITLLCIPVPLPLFPSFFRIIPSFSVYVYFAFIQFIHISLYVSILRYLSRYEIIYVFFCLYSSMVLSLSFWY